MNDNGPAPDSAQMVPPTMKSPAAPAPAPSSPASPNTEANRLENVLPEVKDLARKVGGFDKLADIAKELDRGNE